MKNKPKHGHQETLKELNTQLKALSEKMSLKTSQISSKQSEINQYNKELNQLQKQFTEIENKIEKYTNKNPIISEHAIVRYMERVKKIDIEEIKKEILSEKVTKMISDLGNNGTYPNENGFQLVIKNNVVVTIKN